MKMTAEGVSEAENGSQRGWKRAKRGRNYEMRQKREKWEEISRKRGANYEFSEWHEWRRKTARNGGGNYEMLEIRENWGWEGAFILFSC